MPAPEEIAEDVDELAAWTFAQGDPARLGCGEDELAPHLPEGAWIGVTRLAASPLLVLLEATAIV